MRLSEALRTRVAGIAMAIQGDRVETVTYHARATATAAPVDHRVNVLFRSYSQAALSTGVIELTDQECVIETALTTWTPTQYDDISRADGSLWKVMPIRDGRRALFFHLQTRQVG